MPRHAAKKTNKNARRLPVLINLSAHKNLNKKNIKFNDVNKTNKNDNDIKNNYNFTTKEPIQKKKQINTKARKAFTGLTFTTFDKIKENCNVNITISIPTTKTVNAAATKAITKTPKGQEALKQNKKSASFLEVASKSKILLATGTSVDEIKESGNVLLKEQKCLNIKNDLRNDGNVLLNIYNSKCINTKQSDVCNSEEEISLTLASPLETDTKSSSELAASSSPSLNSSNCSISSLYPIVIETSESFQQNNNNNDNRESEQQQGIKNDTTNIKKKKLHSTNNCLSKSRNTKCYCNSSNCDTAVDTLEQHQTQNTISNNNIIAAAAAAATKTASTSVTVTTISALTLSTKRCNNRNKQKQSIQSSTTITAAPSTANVLTSSKPLSNQSQEVKARLATLRIRKTFLQQKQEESDKRAQSRQKISGSVAAAPELITEKDFENTVIREPHTTQLGKYFARKPLPGVDDDSLNLIETLSDEVKKPNNKRRRNNPASILLGLGTLHQPRPKRIAANSAVQSDKTVAGLTASAVGTDKNNPNPTAAVNFLRPLPIEVTNTNSKKRARIMSLYERPFQATSDGRGSVVGNGYMTSIRSSASSGATSATGVLVINDTCDTQEMANQYYMSGSSSSGLVANSSQSLLGNGSAINHAPTMGTLCNIGNTCYLNSVVYTLRFAPQFLHNLHHLLGDLNALQQNIARSRAKSSSLGRGVSAMHMENARSWSSKDLASMEQYASSSAATAAASGTNATAITQITQKSTHQLLTEKLHELYQSLHRNEINASTEPHHADTLLHAIQDVSSIFEGNQQQDAHEFLMCLLNSIRETSQTLIKAIAECPDVILNGYISNPDEIERDLIKNHSGTVGSGVGVGGSNSSNSNNSLASTSSKTSSFFSRKSKRKDESKNSKNSRLQSPLKDALLAGNSETTVTANSLFYLNTIDLSLSSVTSPASATDMAVAGSSVASPSNTSASQMTFAGDATNAPTSVASVLKDKQRLEGKIRELGLDFFNEDFEGITVSTTKCLSCETITEQKETMIDIAVPVPQAGYESNEFMDRPSSFIQNSCITREYFRNENKYRCEQCCGYTEAIRSISYEVLPRLLIIQLSRFSGGMEKINSYIPTCFTLQCFCSKCCELSDANKLHIYKLYSVITHVGATMSVGHYIAYTCSLEWANEYINCPKEQTRRRASQERNLCATGGGNGIVGGSSGGNSSQSSGMGGSSTGFMKMKMKFGRSKASSFGDMSKNVKQLNGLNSSSKAITNGIGKLTMNSSGGGGVSVIPQCPVTCQSINCCAMRLTAQQQLQYQSANNSTSDFSEESSQYSNGSAYNHPNNYNNNIHHGYNGANNSSGYGSTGRGSTKAFYATTPNNYSEPIWYMCDDDKIKAMTQREFEELLSPARKITITPYLLFYARYNLQSTPPKSCGTASKSSPGPVTSSPQTSWSNESLQSSGHSAHSSGIRM